MRRGDATLEEVEEKIRRLQQALSCSDLTSPTRLASGAQRERDSGEDWDPALRPLLDRGYSLPLARKACLLADLT